MKILESIGNPDFKSQNIVEIQEDLEGCEVYGRYFNNEGDFYIPLCLIFDKESLLENEKNMLQESIKQYGTTANTYVILAKVNGSYRVGFCATKEPIIFKSAKRKITTIYKK